MKSVYFTEDHELFRQTVRAFMETEVAPHAEEWEAARRIPREIWRKMGEMGFLGIIHPEEYGGTNADIFYGIVFLEELCRSRMGGFVAAVGVQEFIATGAIWHRGTHAQKERYLRPSIEGTKVGAICISEPDAGSDVAALRTTAVRDGDHWVINGAKTWITNGVYADFHVVACKTDREAGAHGISLIVVETDTPGVSTSKLNKMGWHSSDTAEIAYENVRVPAENLIGELNAGFKYIMETFAIERLVTAAMSIGTADVAFEETLAYMSEREAFGRPINKFQALRHRLADLFTEVLACKQLIYHTAWLHQQGLPAVKESSMAKLLATELQKRVVDECLQFFGGFGYVEEYPMARFYRDARVGTIVAGTSEIMREIIAKAEIDGVNFQFKPKAGAASPPAATPTPGASAEAPTAETPAAPAPSAPATAASTSPQAGGATAVAEPGPGGEAPAPGGPPTTIAAFFRSLPARHRPEKTEGWSARVHFKFTDSPTPEWTVVIDGAHCAVEPGLHGEATCTVTTTELLYLGIEGGSESPEMAFMMGKIKVSSPSVMLRYMKAFRRVGR